MRVPPAKVSFPDEDRALILDKIDKALQSGQLTLGAYGREFEEAFAARHGAAHGVAVSSGTSALEIPLRCIGVEGKEVLVPSNTFFATGAAAVHAGADPVFVDCDPETMAIDPDAVRKAIGPDTAAVIVVHIGGLITPAIDELRSICDENGVDLVEDAAHAHGSSFQGRSAGTFGRAASFSFYPTKVMAGGEGGIILTDDEALATEARTYRDQGKASFLDNRHTKMGANWRMSEPHAAIAMSQLGRLDQFIARRQEIAARYDAALPAIGLKPLHVPADASCNYYKYIAFLPDGVDRVELKKTLREEFDVGLSGEVYEAPLHLQPVFEPWNKGELPGAEWLTARHVCLPLYPDLSDEDADYVVECLGTTLARFGATA
jgi:dTDP-4-amino-4,6-dideoxygalactose transaminase